MDDSLPQYKVILIGESGVGKSALTQRLVKNDFDQEIPETIGAQYESVVLDIGKARVNLALWDTAGQERFRSIAKSYFRSAVGAIIVYDITQKNSFDEVSNWLNLVHTLCDPGAVAVLVGNKSDLENNRVVPTDEAEHFASSHDLVFFETSAVTGQNVQDAFLQLAQMVYDKSFAVSKNSLPKKKTDSNCC